MLQPPRTVVYLSVWVCDMAWLEKSGEGLRGKEVEMILNRKFSQLRVQMIKCVANLSALFWTICSLSMEEGLYIGYTMAAQ